MPVEVQFFLGQAIVLLMAVVTALWVVSNKIADKLDKQFQLIKEDQARQFESIRAEQKEAYQAFHDHKGTMFARFDMLKLEISKDYIKKEIHDKDREHTIDKFNTKLEGSNILLQVEFRHIKDELISLTQKVDSLTKGIKGRINGVGT